MHVTFLAGSSIVETTMSVREEPEVEHHLRVEKACSSLRSYSTEVLGPRVGYPLRRGTNEDQSEPCVVPNTSVKIPASSTRVCISTLLFIFRIYIKHLSFNLVFILILFMIETQPLRQRQQHLDKTQFAHSSLINCICFALGIYLWPSLLKVLEVLIHPLLGVTCFFQF